ncbi:MAG: carbohydrate ABC transporter permease [Chloroflexi bacterium]|nr:carbohydrate ABC transporter permease [Chloroflexota bacterium]
MKNFFTALWQNKNRVLIYGALIVIVILNLLPIALTLIVSFKTQDDITHIPPQLFPCDTPTQSFDPGACRWSVEGYERVLMPQPSPDSIFGFELTGKMVATYGGNTVLYATVASLFVVLLAATSGYAFSRYRFRGHGALLTGIIAITGVPLLTNLLALYQMGITIRTLDLPYDDRAFIILIYVGFFLPLSVWIAKGFFDSIPRDLEEAAMIDGCSPLGALFRVTMPLATPGMIAIFMLTFVNVWNEFLAGYLLVTKNANKPLMFGLYDFLGQNLVNLQVVAAACAIIALPVVVLFLFFRRSFFTAMVEGSVKG